MCTTPFVLSSCRLLNASAAASPVFDIVLTTAERALLEALNDLGVRYLIVGMGAALIEGAPATTQDLDLETAREYELDGVQVKVLPLERVIVSKRAAKRPKDSAQIPILEATLAARKAGTGDMK